MRCAEQGAQWARGPRSGRDPGASGRCSISCRPAAIVGRRSAALARPAAVRARVSAYLSAYPGATQLRRIPAVRRAADCRGARCGRSMPARDSLSCGWEALPTARDHPEPPALCPLRRRRRISRPYLGAAGRRNRSAVDRPAARPPAGGIALQLALLRDHGGLDWAGAERAWARRPKSSPLPVQHRRKRPKPKGLITVSRAAAVAGELLGAGAPTTANTASAGAGAGRNRPVQPPGLGQSRPGTLMRAALECQLREASTVPAGPELPLGPWPCRGQDLLSQPCWPVSIGRGRVRHSARQPPPLTLGPERRWRAGHHERRPDPMAHGVQAQVSRVTDRLRRPGAHNAVGLGLCLRMS